jgi:integrase
LSDTEHLFQRGKNGTWYVRRAVPASLRKTGEPKLLMKSTGTSDRQEAKRRAHPILAEWEARFRAGAVAPLPRTPSDHDLEAAAVMVGYDGLREHEAGRRLAAASAGGERWQRYQRRTAINLSAAEDRGTIRSLADAAIDDLGIDLAPDSGGYAKLCEYLASARHAALDTSYRAAHGEIAPEPEGGIVTRVRERSAARAKPGETLLELFEKWAAEMLAKNALDGKRGKRADTINQDRKVVQQFVAFVGNERAVDSITPEEIADYRDVLRDLPPKWASHNALKRLNMRDAAVKARELDLPRVAFTTINKHLSTISPLYTWLRKHPRWAGMKNPVDGLHYDDVKGANPRPPFTTPVLNKILQSPLFAGFIADGDEHKAGNQHVDDWRKWIPLVCMFTGARIGEIAQLRVGDVRQEHGVWMIHIAHDDSAGQSTKSGHSRPAAVHSKLEAIGFLAFVERQRKRAGGDNAAQLFPELKPNNRGQIGAEPSRWWRDYLAAIGVKQGRDGIGAHSFRHELADRLRDEARLMDNEVAVCLGHSLKSTTGGYGQLRQGTVTMLKDWIEAVRWEGVDFEGLGNSV